MTPEELERHKLNVRQFYQARYVLYSAVLLIMFRKHVLPEQYRYEMQTCELAFYAVLFLWAARHLFWYLRRPVRSPWGGLTSYSTLFHLILQAILCLTKSADRVCGTCVVPVSISTPGRVFGLAWFYRLSGLWLGI
jgi:hypothetical protein